MHQLGMLRNHRTHEQTTIAAALDRELLRSSVLLIDQIFSGRGEIIKDVLLVSQISGFVPFLTELTAAADVGDDVDATAIEPESTREIEVGRHAHAVSAVAVEHGRIIAVERC